MNWSLRSWSLVLLAGTAVSCARHAPPAKDGPPVAPIRTVVDDYYGTKVPDPYRYFENIRDPEVITWVKGQARYAQKVLGSISGRDQLLARIRELDAGQPFRIRVLRRWPDGALHYLKISATENLEKLYYRDSQGAERLLIDPDRLKGQDGKHVALSFCVPSPNRRYVAYGTAAAGSEQTVLHVLDVEAAKDLPDVIDRMESDYTPPHWLADSTGFVYSRRRLLPPDAPATEEYKKSSACLHRLGSEIAKDPVIFSMGVSKSVPMDEADFPSVVIVPGSNWAIGKIHHGDARQLSLYVAPVSALSSGQVPWKKICVRSDEVTDFAVRGDWVYLVSGAGAPRYKLVRTKLDAPDFAGAQVVLPPGNDVVQTVSSADDAVYIDTLRDGMGQVLFLANDSNKPEPVALPAGEPSGVVSASSPDTRGVLITTAAWTRAGRTYLFDPATRSLKDMGLRPRGKYDDLPGFESKEVLVTSHDGVKVPLSILFRSGLKLDGSHPTLVVGYGAYGMSSQPSFNPTRFAWLERGGVLAIAHVRGGGEYGREWHDAGQKATKPNTWKDFIACCQYLVDQKYTSPAKLAGQGGSAGGILIGRSITQRPELFAAALINVGCLDALRMETTANGVPNIQEFGSFKTSEGFRGLLEMSAYAHVRDGVKYPAVLLTHGINDPRVEPWQSAKMTARLQAATASGKPVLFRVDFNAGHGIGSTRSQRQEETADQWAFLLWQMGEAGFSR